MPVIWICAALSVLGGVLPLGALGVGARRLVRAHRKLAGQLVDIERIQAEDSLSPAERRTRTAAILQPLSTVGYVLYTREWTREAIMRNAVEDLRGPALWGAAGVVCGTIASVWSLWL